MTLTHFVSLRGRRGVQLARTAAARRVYQRERERQWLRRRSARTNEFISHILLSQRGNRGDLFYSRPFDPAGVSGVFWQRWRGLFLELTFSQNASVFVADSQDTNTEFSSGHGTSRLRNTGHVFTHTRRTALEHLSRQTPWPIPLLQLGASQPGCETSNWCCDRGCSSSSSPVCENRPPQNSRNSPKDPEK